ncbi:MAG TPA: peptidylprolyl isomerase [Aggregatilinea sp.]|uniref:peptidylprolyl isomerase n=1 Tax=Aggregatilinea sp. TaxID=2806333 RepID=UPI002C49BC34|nr:peptidylprolyl isomerase [Aggregatilinea sp.]HML24758.1 peptidylprolyl isomerase [Aggregatilinea sp.]
MAKKSTTGGPRPRRVTEADVQRRTEYKSRAERDQMWQRRFLAVIVALVAISAVVLVFAVVQEQVIVPNQAITKVNGDEVKTSDFQARVRFLRWQTAEQIRQLYALTGGDLNTLQQYASQQISQLQTPALFGGQVLDEMEEELILQQTADDRGITIDDAEVDRQVDDYMAQSVGLTLPEQETSTPTTVPSVTPTPLVSATPSNTPAPTTTPTPLPTSASSTAEATEAAAATEAVVEPDATATAVVTSTPTATLEESQIQGTLENAANNYFDSAKEGSDVDRDVVREVFYYQALRQAVMDDVTKDTPTSELQVNTRHILFAFNPANPQDTTPPTDEQRATALAQAEAAMEALQNGEPFADLAKAMSDDTGSATGGGSLGWSSPDVYDPAFGDAALNANLGEIVGPVESQFGYHIIQVLGREVRDLTPSQLSSAKSEAFTTWLDAQKASADIERNDNWIDRVPEEPTYSELLGDILPIS